ncbi:7547_t:CDS:2, partial [Racocetra fulgida]
GVDGKRGVGKSCLIKKFADDDFENGKYKNTFHAYVTTTTKHIRLDDYDIKVEFLETNQMKSELLNPNWNLFFFQIMELYLSCKYYSYYSYIDGAILVYDISQYDGLKEIKELSCEYSKIPIMIIANNCDKNEDDLLKEVKNYFGNAT